MIFVASYISEEDDRSSSIYQIKESEFIVVIKDSKQMKYKTFSGLKVAEDYAEEWVTKNE
jgi:hypothetical protein